MTLKELLLKKETLNQQAQAIVASIQPTLKPLEDELTEIEKQIGAKALEAAKQRFGQMKMDTGIVNFETEQVMIKAVISKTVKWSQEGLASVYDRIKSAGDDPAQYLKVAYDVPETKYKEWPDAVKAVFEPHRTVVPSKPKFEFKIVEGNGDAAKPPWEA